MAATRTRAPASKKRPAATKGAATSKAGLTFADAMAALEKAGTAQARKTYARHGVTQPMFGVSFATLKVLAKKAGRDQDLARALWKTGNFDARNLACKVADPEKTTADDLDLWAETHGTRSCSGYVAMLAAERSDGFATAKRWFASKSERHQDMAWRLVSQLALRDETTPEAWLAERLSEIEASIHASSNDRKEAMNAALIAIGGRSPSLRKAALAASRRIGKVDVDHGDTECKTPDAASYIEKTWEHAKAKGFASPAAQERGREPPRTRC